MITYSIIFNILAGVPAIITSSGTLCVTTEFAPITTLLPIVTFGIIHTFLPIHTLEPICIGPLLYKFLFDGIIVLSSLERLPCELSHTNEFAPKRHPSPIIISLQQEI